MLYHGWVVLLAALSAALGPTTLSSELPEAARKEMKALQGQWRVVKCVHSDRETIAGEDDGAIIVEFKGNTIDFDSVASGTIAELDPATDPKCLDFKTPTGSGVFKPGST